MGGYGCFVRNNDVIHGFRLSGTNWITLDDPLTGSGPDQGTYAAGVSGTNIVGWYVHGIVANACTKLDDPLAGFASGQGTTAFSISGTNIVGRHQDASNNLHGFLYDGRTWTRLDDPQAEPGSFGVGGTVALGIDGASIVGIYIHSDGVYNGFLATPIPHLAITQGSSERYLSG